MVTRIRVPNLMQRKGAFSEKIRHIPPAVAAETQPLRNSGTARINLVCSVAHECVCKSGDPRRVVVNRKLRDTLLSSNGIIERVLNLRTLRDALLSSAFCTFAVVGA